MMCGRALARAIVFGGTSPRAAVADTSNGSNNGWETAENGGWLYILLYSDTTGYSCRDIFLGWSRGMVQFGLAGYT